MIRSLPGRVGDCRRSCRPRSSPSRGRDFSRRRCRRDCRRNVITPKRPSAPDTRRARSRRSSSRRRRSRTRRRARRFLGADEDLVQIAVIRPRRSFHVAPPCAPSGQSDERTGASPGFVPLQSICVPGAL
jgi:hypothetical protein